MRMHGNGGGALVSHSLAQDRSTTFTTSGSAACQHQQGLAALSLCTAVRPRCTRFTKRVGAAVAGAAVRPSPTLQAADAAARWRSSAWVPAARSCQIAGQLSHSLRCVWRYRRHFRELGWRTPIFSGRVAPKTPNAAYFKTADGRTDSHSVAVCLQRQSARTPCLMEGSVAF